MCLSKYPRNRHSSLELLNYTYFVLLTVLDLPASLIHMASSSTLFDNSYELELPASIKVHPIFHTEKLRRSAATKPLEGQHQDPALPIQVPEADEWEVDSILGSRLHYRKL